MSKSVVCIENHFRSTHCFENKGRINCPTSQTGERPKCAQYKSICHAGNQIFKQSNLFIDNGVAYGYCLKCYKQICIDRNWDKDLSYDANNFCDNKNISLIERKKINQTNIYNLLKLSSHEYYNHLSHTRRQEGERQIDRKQIDAFQSDDDAGLACDSRSAQSDDDDDIGNEYKNESLSIESSEYEDSQSMVSDDFSSSDYSDSNSNSNSIMI